MLDIKYKQKQVEAGVRRGWIIYLLYINLPKPITFRMLTELLDFYDFPLSCRRLAEKLEFLRELKFIRVFPLGSEESLTDVQQAKLIQRYCDSDGDLEDRICLSLTTKGVNYQEAHFDETGVMRMNG